MVQIFPRAVYSRLRHVAHSINDSTLRRSTCGPQPYSNRTHSAINVVEIIHAIRWRNGTCLQNFVPYCKRKKHVTTMQGSLVECENQASETSPVALRNDNSRKLQHASPQVLPAHHARETHSIYQWQQQRALQKKEYQNFIKHGHASPRDS